MADIFAVLETEDVIQEQDKSRFSGIKSYTNSSTALTAVDIKLGKNGPTITKTSGTDTDWFTDYQFPFTVDVDATNNKLDFKEGAGELTATIPTLEYTLAALATAIKTALEAAGALTYTVSVDTETNKLTISAPTTFSLLALTGTNEAVSLYPDIGFTGTVEPNTPVGVLSTVDFEGEITYEGKKIRTVNKEITLTAKNVADSDGVTTKTIQIISTIGDELWSTDDQLQQHEPDILRWVKDGRATFKNTHRLMQTQILAWLDKEGMVDIFDKKYTKDHMLLPDELAQWSKFGVLRLIFDGISNKIDDIFFDKARDYEKKEAFHRGRLVLRLDVDKDGKVDLNEQVDIASTTVVRR